MLEKYKDLKISSKLIIGFLIVAILAGVIGVIGIININRLGEADTKLYVNNTLGLNDIGNAQGWYQRIRFNVVKGELAAGTDVQEESLNKIAEYVIEAEDHLNSYKASIVDPEDQAMYDTLLSEWQTYMAMVNDAVDMMRAGKSDEVKIHIFGDMQDSGSAVQASFDKLFDYNTTLAAATSANNMQLVKTSMILMISVAAAGILIAILLGVAISRMISKPLNMMADDAGRLALGDVEIAANASKIGKDEVGKLTLAMMTVIEGRKKQVQETRQLADGDLTVEINISSDKDVLGQSLSNLVDSLNEVVVSIMNSAEQVASGADLVSNSSMALSQGATEQASSVEQLTASLQEIGSKTTLSASNAQSANELARLAKKDAEEGNEQMKDMLSAMEAINVSSSSISKIIKVIDDIAFQTNILALNAAVEAARAGQHGRGFAVVAEEVRNLAAKSANAAKETTDMIEGSIKKVEAGTKIATETANALVKIVSEVAKAADLVENIAIASTEQASAIEQINQGILMISQVVQNNAATSEESAAASEELSSQAEQLKETISMFKVKNNGRPLNIDNPVRQSTPKLNAGHNALRPARAAITQKATLTFSETNLGKY
jgi:methyl-accepting chemotaxis protein